MMEQKQISGNFIFPWIVCTLLLIYYDLRYANATPLHLKEGQRVYCPSGWASIPITGKCFRYVRNLCPWNEAESHCNDYGGHLASLRSLQERYFGKKLCNDSVKGCWLGGRLSGFGWKWSDNTSTWNASFPNNGAPVKNNSIDLCTLLTNGSLIAANCNKPHGFMCTLHDEYKCLGMQCRRGYLIILAVVSGLILSTTLGIVVWLLAYKQSQRNRRSISASALPPWKIYSKEELKSITKNFSEGNRLPGDAKTGGTYNGILCDGLRVVVKRLKSSNFHRKKEFYSEIGRVARLYHPNLVAINGCCYDRGGSCYIVYEFIANGPLDRWLYHMPKSGRSLDWGMRMKIATTLAQAIVFLHDKVKPQVVHRNIRASNVLLDEGFGAHLMGVGVSKFVPWEVILHERRNHGYLAPEFVFKNELTTKSDVYSFGVLLLEMVSGRKPGDSMGWQSILEWATPLVQSHQYLQLLDPALVLPCFGEAQVQKVVELVYACTQPVPSVRPRMSHVLHQLQQLPSFV